MKIFDGTRRPAGREAPVVRPLLAADLSPLMANVGPLVDSLYDDGASKLLRRLEDARDGYATAHVVTAGAHRAPVALATETGKGRYATKLSTFWVDPQFRRQGLGRLLLEQRVSAWQRTAQDSVTVTVRRDRAPELEALFVPLGFTRVALEVARYGANRDEVVLRWAPASSISTVAA